MPSQADWSSDAKFSLLTSAERNTNTEDLDETTQSVELTSGFKVVRQGLSSSLSLDGAVSYRSADNLDDDTVEPDVGLNLMYAPENRGIQFEFDVGSRYRDLSAIESSASANERPGDSRFRREDTLVFESIVRSNEAARNRVEAGYRFSAVRTDDDSLLGTNSHSLDFNTRSIFGTEKRTFFYSDFSSDIVEDESGNETAASAEALAGIARALRPRLVGAVQVGYDWFTAEVDDAAADGESTLETFDEQGIVWGVGLSWRPTANVDADFGWTERSFGSSPFVRVGISGRASSVDIAWQRELAFESGSAGLLMNPTTGVGSANLESDPSSGAADQADEDATNGSSTALFGRDIASTTETISLSYEVSGRLLEFYALAEYIYKEELLGESTRSRGEAFEAGLSRSFGQRAVATLRVRQERKHDRSGPVTTGSQEMADSEGDMLGDNAPSRTSRFEFSIDFDFL